MAETNSRSRRSAPPKNGLSASMLASVAPEVKVTWAGSAPTRAATSARAVSTRWRAARPSACTEEALPAKSNARSIAARASGRSGAVAFQSR